MGGGGFATHAVAQPAKGTADPPAIAVVRTAPSRCSNAELTMHIGRQSECLVRL
jgi:hypothetical protein